MTALQPIKCAPDCLLLVTQPCFSARHTHQAVLHKAGYPPSKQVSLVSAPMNRRVRHYRTPPPRPIDLLSKIMITWSDARRSSPALQLREPVDINRFAALAFTALPEPARCRTSSANRCASAFEDRVGMVCSVIDLSRVCDSPIGWTITTPVIQ